MPLIQSNIKLDSYVNLSKSHQPLKQYSKAIWATIGVAIAFLAYVRLRNVGEAPRTVRLSDQIETLEAKLVRCLPERCLNLKEEILQKKLLAESLILPQKTFYHDQEQEHLTAAESIKHDCSNVIKYAKTLPHTLEEKWAKAIFEQCFDFDYQAKLVKRWGQEYRVECKTNCALESEKLKHLNPNNFTSLQIKCINQCANRKIELKKEQIF